MMATAQAQRVDEAPREIKVGEVVLVGIPVAVYRALSDAAAARGLRVEQALAEAMDRVLRGGPGEEK